MSLPEPSASTCRNCGAPLPAVARFCPECGGRVAASADEELPPAASSLRRFGTAPPEALLVLGAAAGVAGIVLLALGSVAAGAVLLVVALAVVAVGVRSAPAGAPAARRLALVRDRGRAVVETVAAQAQAQKELLALRLEVQRLAGERGDRLRELGEAVVREDAMGTESARAAVRQLDETITAKEAEMARVSERASERVGQVRLETRSTMLLEPPEPPPAPEPYPPSVPEPYPPPDEGTPPTPEPVPEPYPPPDEADPPRQP